jgi:undecaprenyl pyrophosphate phosphatase UppP
MVTGTVEMKVVTPVGVEVKVVVMLLPGTARSPATIITAATTIAAATSAKFRECWVVINH